MFLFTSTLIFISAVVSQCCAEQKVKCSYDPKNKDLQRVWCKKDTNNDNCCTGFSFMPGNRELEGGLLSVQDNDQDFIVSVKHLSQGDGVYWCGLTNGSNIIIKLAEEEIHNPMNLIWSIARWLLFVLLLLAVISSHMFCRRRKVKK
ncbi:uncharacterized protein si:ch211-102c2.4 isoform X2 [Neoarius graeffei]|uniref:uncharacterized protein si:ch211-102c2.4 isoform X2 n=1 Tax=Neoarius graeffei TaxID=443677 RepID=UPI00298C89F2|nr:uncharacterized protein si:ch211-102c2.4 isoform X2 [Neoarius graeffei]